MSQKPQREHAAILCGSAAARLIVCERSGRWARALRRELAGAIRVHETRTLADCLKQATPAPASFLVVELASGSVAALFALLGRLERDFPLARLAVVADRSHAESLWALREAGAGLFLTSPRNAAQLAGVARRHLAETPQPPQSLAEQIWSDLPWATSAQGPRPSN